MNGKERALTAVAIGGLAVGVAGGVETGIHIGAASANVQAVTRNVDISSELINGLPEDMSQATLEQQANYINIKLQLREADQEFNSAIENLEAASWSSLGLFGGTLLALAAGANLVYGRREQGLSAKREV